MRSLLHGKLQLSECECLLGLSCHSSHHWPTPLAVLVLLVAMLPALLMDSVLLWICHCANQHMSEDVADLSCATGSMCA